MVEELVDGSGAYSGLQRAGPTFRLAHCRVHTRRKCVEVASIFHSLIQTARLNDIEPGTVTMPSNLD